MNNFHFLQKFQQLQYGIMFDNIIDLKFASLVYCKKDSSAFWNQALINRVPSKVELTEIETTFKRLDRKSTIYFENSHLTNDITTILKAHSYEQNFEDSWMFYPNNPVQIQHKEKVKKVISPQDLTIFLNIFNSCYQKNDPMNPYGELGVYLEVAEETWYQHNKTERVQYFIVYDVNKPVAVSTLITYDKIGYIANVGSLPEVRGKGYGKIATLYCVWVSQQVGNTTHCLATEEKTYPNSFYTRIGFQTHFTALGYSKE